MPERMPDAPDPVIERVAAELLRHAAPGADFDARVMAGVRRSPPSAVVSAWSWLREPRTVAVSPLSGLAMAASLVLRGTINEELFLDCNGEMFFIYAKLKPVLPGLRKAMNSPEFLGQTEKLLHRTAESRKKLKLFEERIAMFTKMRAAAAGEGKQKYGT